ncbi:MAG TPA: class I SAM-dependent methyltransferase [Gaiellaceae bacterium]|nr:class I SAM-dependent methyltransferase [Gaiellaceae bacterium]
MKQALFRRAPNLATALGVYRYLRAQRRNYERAGRDTRPPADLITRSENGALLVVRDHELGDLRLVNGQLSASQKSEEILAFLKRVAKPEPRTICEVGTSAGGTLYLLTRVAADEAVLVSVDLEIPPHVAAARACLARAHQRVVSLAGDSQTDAMVARVRRAVGNRPLDVLFIDGDHSYEGVKRDWELYSPLVRRGGIVGLHDIQEDYATSRGTPTPSISGDVPRFWRELCEQHRTEELIADPGQDGFGIGVVYL